METENRSEKFNNIIAVLIAVVTLMGALIAYLQSDAGARDDTANRDNFSYFVRSFESQIVGDARVNFDSNVAYQAYYEYNLLATSAQNREDELDAARYNRLAQETLKISPMLNEPYFNPAAHDAPKIAQYESDVYLVQQTELMEKYVAASNVKDAWDYKANTYVVHLTLLAVALFLFGLSTTIATTRSRWIFAGAGVALVVVTMIWALALWLKPVDDLRLRGSAIPSLAEGVGLAHQEKYQEAIDRFNKSIEDAPTYVRAYEERGNSWASLGEYQKAVDDLEKAVALGKKDSGLYASIAYTYYLMDDAQQASTWAEKAVAAAPDDIWAQFDLGQYQLALGKVDVAEPIYARAMESAAAQVAEARAANSEPPAYLWEALADGADQVEGLLNSVSAGEYALPEGADGQAVSEASEKLMARLKSLAVALEYTGKPPADGQTAQISPLQFVQPVYDAQGNITDYAESTDTFDAGLQEFAVQFDYSGMKPGSEMIFKLYVNGQEDPSWRIVEPWELGESGSAEIPVSYAYSDTFTFESGEYTVELYIDYQLVQRASFTVSE